MPTTRVTSFLHGSCFQEKKGPKIGGETLLPRGEEQPKFLNSLKWPGVDFFHNIWMDFCVWNTFILDCQEDSGFSDESVGKSVFDEKIIC